MHNKYLRVDPYLSQTHDINNYVKRNTPKGDSLNQSKHQSINSNYMFPASNKFDDGVNPLNSILLSKHLSSNQSINLSGLTIAKKQ